MSQMINGNIGLIVTRQLSSQTFQHVFATRAAIDGNTISLQTREYNYLFPLYIGNGNPEQDSFVFSGKEDDQKQPNLEDPFLRYLAAKLDFTEMQIPDHTNRVSPEDIFHYIYAILHSPTYRARYAEFLKIDFPRIPLTSSLDLFRGLARLGGALVALHLVEFALEDEASAPAAWPRYPRLAHFTGGDRTVDRFPGPDKAWAAGRVAINASSGFDGVPAAVWNFHIGGYQVCHKWLKDRKGRALSDADVRHYAKIVTALHETMRLMGEIDAVIEEYGGWPGAFV
jgi:predicted helicase